MGILSELSKLLHSISENNGVRCSTIIIIINTIGITFVIISSWKLI
jgi:hypothetical protein